MRKLMVPISAASIEQLHVGDTVEISGVIVTARDRAHKFLTETFIDKPAPQAERALYETLRKHLAESAVYHCGPVVVKESDGRWKFVSAGPTTSARIEAFQDKVMEHFGLRAIIGKGGMGPRTLAACKTHKAVYLHAYGGAGALIADRVKEVLTVFRLEDFGMPEAFWVIRVEALPAVVTMDAHGQSLHETIEKASRETLERLLV
jgi:fumarate hydratase class I